MVIKSLNSWTTIYSSSDLDPASTTVTSSSSATVVYFGLLVPSLALLCYDYCSSSSTVESLNFGQCSSLGAQHRNNADGNPVLTSHP